jgi:hypothetical protein
MTLSTGEHGDAALRTSTQCWKTDLLATISIAAFRSRFSLEVPRSDQRIVTTVFAVWQQLVDEMIRRELGDRYLRINEDPSAEQFVDLGLDRAIPERRDTLLGMAQNAHQKFQLIRWFRWQSLIDHPSPSS